LESCVAYDGLPISSGGAHGLGAISASNAYAAWLHFLDVCTAPSTVRSWFDFPQTPDLAAPRQLVRSVNKAFPQDSRYSGRYAVSPDRISEALMLFESFEPLPTNQWGMAPIWLWFAADFRLRTPNSSELWPGQDPALFGHFETPGGVSLGASSARLSLQGKRSFGLSLSIPNATDSDLREVVPWLQSALPMRLSSKHWTRWTLTKSHRSYGGRKITPPQ
jgi:hypothetical protein